MFDISNHYDLIRKVVTSKFSAFGMDTEDLIQDVCYKIHRQNQGSKSYDPDRSSLSHYVYLIADGVVKKRWAKLQYDPLRDARFLSPDMDQLLTDYLEEQIFLITLEDRLMGESETLADILNLTLQGFSRREMARVSPYTEYQIRKGREEIREILRQEIH